MTDVRVAEYPQPPQTLFGELFVAVQMAAVFGDGKTFADAVPNAAPGEILAAFHATHPDSPEALRRFVAVHFTLPAEPAPVVAAPAETPLAVHIEGLWSQLTRTTSTAP